MTKQNIAVMFGGLSPEHEVSVITGIQVMEKIDRTKFNPHAIYQNHNGVFKYLPKFYKRSDFTPQKARTVFLGRDDKGTFLKIDRAFAKKIYIDAAYLAFHGGNGESGQVQGFLETLKIPYTSPNVESSAISMNKQLTKDVLSQKGFNVVDGASFMSKDINNNLSSIIKKIETRLKFPVIIKPTHLGSSISVYIARSEVDLKKYLKSAAMVDSEVLIEKLLKDITEYNCAVRTVNNKLEVSEVERPISSDEILSFADKYQKGSKNKNSGMASLSRELPAKISEKLKNRIQNESVKTYKALRSKGMIRIDFMYTQKGKLYVTEVNPIPGSMAFYLWEASGVSFRQQITDAIEQAILDFNHQESLQLKYESDIVEKFIYSKPQ